MALMSHEGPTAFDDQRSGDKSAHPPRLTGRVGFRQCSGQLQ